MQTSAYRYFLAVAETGSVRQAAERAHISPSAISRQIQLLEHAFGKLLFERRADGMVLTEEGSIVAHYLRSSMRNMELARARIDELHGLVRGTVSFAAIEGVFVSWLLPEIAGFQKRYPGIAFDGRVAASERVLEAVRSDAVDFGVTLEFEVPETSIEVLRRFETRYVAACAANHPLCAERTVGLKQLLQYPLALLNARFQTRQWFDRAVVRQKLEPRIAIELDHIEMLKRIVQAGGHVTVLPDYAISAETDRGELAVRPIQGTATASTNTMLCVRKDRVMPRAVEAFLEQLVRQAPA